MTPNTINRRDARLAGHSTFFTGEPCRNSHVASRRVSNGCCIQCTEAWRKTDKPHASRLMRAGAGKTKTRTVELHVEPDTDMLAIALKERLKQVLGRPVSRSVMFRAGLVQLAERVNSTTDAKAAMALLLL